MFKNIKVSTKLSLGCGIILVLIIILYSMYDIVLTDYIIITVVLSIGIAFMIIRDTTQKLESFKIGLISSFAYLNTKNERIEVSNPTLMQLKDVLNKMANHLEDNIDNVLNILEQYSKYNYLNKVNIKGLKEDLLKLANSVNGLDKAITNILIENKSNELTLDENSDILLENVDKLNQSSNDVASSLEKTAVALEQITSNIINNTENIAKIFELSSSVITVAMEEINNQVNTINEAINIIDQIAFQTNIFSLLAFQTNILCFNAAVEATTAGEAEKGFAVVAQEVQNHTSRSIQVAHEIKTLVETATNKANEGKNISFNIINGYKHLNDNISQTINLIHDIQSTSKVV